MDSHHLILSSHSPCSLLLLVLPWISKHTCRHAVISPGEYSASAITSSSSRGRFSELIVTIIISVVMFKIT